MSVLVLLLDRGMQCYFSGTQCVLQTWEQVMHISISVHSLMYPARVLSFHPTKYHSSLATSDEVQTRNFVLLFYSNQVGYFCQELCVPPVLQSCCQAALSVCSFTLPFVFSVNNRNTFVSDPLSPSNSKVLKIVSHWLFGSL